MWRIAGMLCLFVAWMQIIFMSALIRMIEKIILSRGNTYNQMVINFIMSII